MKFNLPYMSPASIEEERIERELEKAKVPPKVEPSEKKE